MGTTYGDSKHVSGRGDFLIAVRDKRAPRSASAERFGKCECVQGRRVSRRFRDRFGSLVAVWLRRCSKYHQQLPEDGLPSMSHASLPWLQHWVAAFELCKQGLYSQVFYK